MALSNLKTPGVYIQEISTLPSSIIPVATAIPGFLGYTEKTIIDGVQWNYTTPAPAVRISSFVEFQQFFGGAFREKFDASIDINGKPTVKAVSVTSPDDAPSPYRLFYHMQMYFANGGGPCHIISVGNYDYSSPVINADDFYDSGNPAVGLGQAEKVDEITLLVAPEVIAIIDNSGDPDYANIKPVYDAMLAQCNKLKDRFSIFDVVSTSDPNADATEFRDKYVGANYLKYGAAYYPPLTSTISLSYSDNDVRFTADNRAVTNTYATVPNNRLATAKNGIGSSKKVTVSTNPTPLTNSIVISALGSSLVTLTAGIDFAVGTTATITASNIVVAINNHPVLSLVARAQETTPTPSADFYVVVRAGVTDTSTATLNIPTATWFTLAATVGGALNSQNLTIYNDTRAAIDEITGLLLPPSATMAGIYAAVDNDRGVWKAPANVGVTGIIGPSVMITESQQSDLNVDATSGKSVNAIRSFVGRGTLVWGARTLDGNSNEWRYVPVRRLFIFVEESTKKASEFVVFEPNDKNTWLRVKGMINNFLTDLWKQGALQGDKPEQAFFVQVGLGETMTAQDILEGKMIVTIGMAAVRPAEFIVLQFMHKLQEA